MVQVSKDDAKNARLGFLHSFVTSIDVVFGLA